MEFRSFFQILFVILCVISCGDNPKNSQNKAEEENRQLLGKAYYLEKMQEYYVQEDIKNQVKKGTIFLIQGSPKCKACVGPLTQETLVVEGNYFLLDSNVNKCPKRFKNQCFQYNKELLNDLGFGEFNFPIIIDVDKEEVVDIDIAL